MAFKLHTFTRRSVNAWNKYEIGTGLHSGHSKKTETPILCQIITTLLENTERVYQVTNEQYARYWLFYDTDNRRNATPRRVH